MSRHYASTALGQIHLRREGQGPALLLLGSTGRSLRMFDGLVALLRDTFTVVAPDLPGCGNSDPLPAGATMTDIAACMIEVMDAQAIARAHLYGFHTGNKIAAAMAARWPQRVHRLVLAGQSHSLVPVNEERNGVIRGRTGNYFEGHAARGTQAQAIRDWDSLQRSVNALWWPAGSTAQGPQCSAALERARSQVLDEIQCTAGIPALYEANFAHDFHGDLQRVTVPTLVLEVETPEENRKLGPQAARVCALIPGSRARALQAQGFRLTLEEHSGDVAAVLREFLGPCESSVDQARL